MTSSIAAVSEMKTERAVQTGPFFDLPPELRKFIYGYVSEIKEDEFSEDARVAFNDMKIPGLFLTCRQVLEEGISIFGAPRHNALLDIRARHPPSSLSTHLILHYRGCEEYHASEMVKKETKHILNPATKALFQVFGHSLQIQSLRIVVCPANIQRSPSSHLEHNMIYLHIRCDDVGSVSIGPAWGLKQGEYLVDDEFEDVMKTLVKTVQAALEVTTKTRATKAFQYQDLETILAACADSFWCFGVAECRLSTVFAPAHRFEQSDDDEDSMERSNDFHQSREEGDG